MATLHIDNTNKTGDLTGTDWTFTNGSTAVSSAGNGDAVNDGLVLGDYIRANGGTQWYKIATVTDGDNLVITPAFQQTTISGTGTINWQDVSVKDGTSTANAWVHPALYTTDTVRTAGDTGKMRANQTHVLAGKDLVADEDGTLAAYLTLKGCDSVDDPWSDSSDVHVIFDFSDTAFQGLWQGDRFWKLDNIDVIQSSEATGGLKLDSSDGTIVDDCVCRDCATHGLFINSTGNLKLSNFSAHSNGTSNIYISSSHIEISNSILNGGVGTTDYGLSINLTCMILLRDVTFGVTSAHSTASISLSASAPKYIISRRCKFDDDPAFLVNIDNPAVLGSYLKSEDHNQVAGSYYAEYSQAVIQKETVEVRVGGALSSIEVTPNSNCTTNFPITVMEWEEQAVPDAEQTRGLAIKQGLADPAGFPANTELYLEAEYYNHATNDTVATAVSIATLSVYETWTWFPVVFTPAQVQKVRYRAWLGVKKGSEAYYIDNQLYDADPT